MIFFAFYSVVSKSLPQAFVHHTLPNVVENSAFFSEMLMLKFAKHVESRRLTLSCTVG
jgi:hypothetical protein